MKEPEEDKRKWMETLANKYDISIETVEEFYDSISFEYRSKSPGKRKITENFFDLYFEGVSNEFY